MDSARFWSQVEISDACWLWHGANDGRYGVVRWNGRLTKAHRVAWEIDHREAPQAQVLHRCDTPLCVRPSHLFEGTQADNLADMKAKGRGANAMTHRPVTRCPRGHAYDAPNTRWHDSKRYCRACQRERARERYALESAQGAEQRPETGAGA